MPRLVEDAGAFFVTAMMLRPETVYDHLPSGLVGYEAPYLHTVGDEKDLFMPYCEKPVVSVRAQETARQMQKCGKGESARPAAHLRSVWEYAQQRNDACDTILDCHNGGRVCSPDVALGTRSMAHGPVRRFV